MTEYYIYEVTNGMRYTGAIVLLVQIAVALLAFFTAILSVQDGFAIYLLLTVFSSAMWAGNKEKADEVETTTHDFTYKH